MKESDPNARKRTDPRPAYIELGDDTDGAFHVYRTTDETIHVVQNGERVQKFVLNGRSVDDYVKFVRDDVSPGFYFEVEFPLGAADLPGRLVGQLCGDCAGWAACDINYNGIDADEDASDQLTTIIDEETRRMNELEEPE